MAGRRVDHGVDPEMLRAWLAGRSLARGLPMPVAERGGFRVDTNSDAETRRWVFPHVGDGLKELARSIVEPRCFLKLCGSADELKSALPTGWIIHAPGYFMQATGAPPQRGLADGYRIDMRRSEACAEVRVLSDTGALAASGFAAETEGAFVYDRIVTVPEHRRKGLAQLVMATLRSQKRNGAVPELLVATEEGRALYARLGWRTVSPYSTASIPAP